MEVMEHHTKYNEFFNVTDNDSGSFNANDDFDVAITTADLARVSISTVATAAFITSAFIAFNDMKSRQQRVQQLVNLVKSVKIGHCTARGLYCLLSAHD